MTRKALAVCGDEGKGAPKASTSQQRVWHPGSRQTTKTHREMVGEGLERLDIWDVVRQGNGLDVSLDDRGAWGGDLELLDDPGAHGLGAVLHCILDKLLAIAGAKKVGAGLHLRDLRLEVRGGPQDGAHRLPDSLVTDPGEWIEAASQN